VEARGETLNKFFSVTMKRWYYVGEDMKLFAFSISTHTLTTERAALESQSGDMEKTKSGMGSERIC